MGDGRARHGRTLAHVFGTRSLRYFGDQGMSVTPVKQAAKHRYLFFLHKTWRKRLRVPTQPYPKWTQAESDAQENTE